MPKKEFAKKLGLGKKVERKKVRIPEKVEIFFVALFHVLEYLDGIRKKVRAEKSSNRRKSRTFFLSNFFPPIFFWFIWNQMCYRDGRPLILKLIPNNEEWNNKVA